MSKLSDLLFPTLPTPNQRRATELAKADYRLLSSLVRVRKVRGLSQQDVADKLGLSQPTIASFERYDADPKLSTIRRYAHAVGAIVTHEVAVDRGQMDHLDDWSAATFRFDYSPHASTKHTYPAPSAKNSKRTDFALAS